MAKLSILNLEKEKGLSTLEILAESTDEALVRNVLETCQKYCGRKKEVPQQNGVEVSYEPSFLNRIGRKGWKIDVSFSGENYLNLKSKLPYDKNKELAKAVLTKGFIELTEETKNMFYFIVEGTIPPSPAVPEERSWKEILEG